MAGIDLTGIRHKTGLRVGGWIDGVRRCDEYRTGCRQSRRRGDENAAFMTNLPWLVLKTTAKAPLSFRRAAIGPGGGRGSGRTRP
jgi:hypothetical protein